MGYLTLQTSKQLPHFVKSDFDNLPKAGDYLKQLVRYKQALALNLQCSVLNAVLTTNMWDDPLYLNKAH